LKLTIAFALAAVSSLFFGFSNICFKIGVGPLGELGLSKLLSAEYIGQIVGSRWIIAGVLLTICSGVFYLTALSYGELVQVVAVLSLSYLVTAVLANAFLDEALNITKIGGFALIILGILLVHLRTG